MVNESRLQSKTYLITAKHSTTRLGDESSPSKTHILQTTILIIVLVVNVMCPKNIILGSNVGGSNVGGQMSPTLYHPFFVSIAMNNDFYTLEIINHPCNRPQFQAILQCLYRQVGSLTPPIYEIAKIWDTIVNYTRTPIFEIYFRHTCCKIRA